MCRRVVLAASRLATTPTTEIRVRQRKCFGNVTACIDALSINFGNLYVSIFREQGAHKVVVDGQLLTLQNPSVTIGQGGRRRLAQQQLYGSDLSAGFMHVKREGVETVVVTLANGVRVRVTGK